MPSLYAVMSEEQEGLYEELRTLRRELEECRSVEGERAKWIAVGESVAALRIELRRAKHDREMLNNPMWVRISDEPRRERAVTDEERAKWQAEADAKVAGLEQKIAALLSGAV